MKTITTLLSIFTAALLFVGCAASNAQMEEPDEQASDDAAVECPEGTVEAKDVDEDAPLAERCLAEADADEANRVEAEGAVETDTELEATENPAEGRIEPGPSTPGEPEDGGDPVPPKGPQD